jgi:K+-sensing histidine kinase KdpD
MWIVKRAEPVAVALAVVLVATAVLWMVKQSAVSEQHPVFFYLLPIALVTMLYGSLPAVLCVVVAMECADFFLYDPLYSIDLPSWGEFGDLVCFALVALISVKCTSELFHRSARNPPKSRYGNS